MIAMNGYNIQPTEFHGTIQPVGRFDLNDIRGQFFGVDGEAEIRDKPNGRDLHCPCTYRDFDTSSELNDWLKELDSQINELTGTINMTGNMTVDYENCTFKGFLPDQTGVMKDKASDKWRVKGTLFWRQRSRG